MVRMTRFALGAGLAALAAATLWWAAAADPPPRPAPSFTDGWDERGAPVLGGDWAAAVTDERYEGGADACVLRFQSAGGGAIRVRADAADGSWRSWGDGTLEGRRVRFRWTGPRGWAGSADFELAEDDRSMRGTFVREGLGRTEYAVARRR